MKCKVISGNAGDTENLENEINKFLEETHAVIQKVAVNSHIIDYKSAWITIFMFYDVFPSVV